MQPEGSKNSESPAEGHSELPPTVSGQPLRSHSQADGGSPREKSRKKRQTPDFRRLWMSFTPFFLSAVLYLSGFFAVFAPLPLLVQRYLGVPLALRLLASLTNGGIAFLLGDAGAGRGGRASAWGPRADGHPGPPGTVAACLAAWACKARR